jgi:phosphoribosyl 1,2-cyclic phosphodiesterase
MAARLKSVGLDWSAVHAVVLTHTHGDHWNGRTLALLRRHKIPFYCHESHAQAMAAWSRAMIELRQAGLVRTYRAHVAFDLEGGIRCLPLPVPHDSEPTFAFRMEGRGDLFGQGPALGYAADLGLWSDELAETFAGVDLLAIEFNHDVYLEQISGRSPRLIARVLGEEGHLSNDQAAGLVRAVLERPSGERLRHLVQLHLSKECNRPTLARQAARSILQELAPLTRLITARQDRSASTLRLIPAGGMRQRISSRRPVVAESRQLWLPGLGGISEV